MTPPNWRSRPSIQQMKRSDCAALHQLISRHESILFILHYPDGSIADQSNRALSILKSYAINCAIYDVTDDHSLESEIQYFSGWQYFPQFYVSGEFIGGASILDEYFSSGEFEQTFKVHRRILNELPARTDKEMRSAIWRVSFNEKSGLLASGNADGTLSIQPTAHRQVPWSLQMHHGWINALCFDASGENVFTAGTDRTFCKTNISTTKRLTVPQAHSRWVNDIVVMNKASLAVSVGADRTVALWNTGDLSLVQRTQSSDCAYWCVCAVLDEQLIAVGDATGCLSFFDGRTLALVNKFRTHQNCISTITSDGSERAFTGSYDGVVKSVGLRGEEESFHGHRSRIWSVVKLPNNHVAAAAADGRILVWRSGNSLPVHEFTVPSVPLSLAWSSVLKSIYVGTMQGDILSLRMECNEASQ